MAWGLPVWVAVNSKSAAKGELAAGHAMQVGDGKQIQVLDNVWRDVKRQRAGGGSAGWLSNQGRS